MPVLRNSPPRGVQIPAMLQAISELSQRVEQLEQAKQPAAESLTPNYLTMNPDGTTGAKFTGGLQLNEYEHGGIAPVSAPFDQALTWQRSDGTTAAQIFGDRNTQNPTATERIALSAYQDANGGSAGHLASVYDAANNLVASLLLLRENGVSDILKLASSANRAIDFGGSTLTFSASASTTRTVNHGLGRTPQAVLATGQGITGSFILHTDTFTSTTFRAVGVISAATTNTFSFSWLAIG